MQLCLRGEVLSFIPRFSAPLSHGPLHGTGGSENEASRAIQWRKGPLSYMTMVALLSSFSNCRRREGCEQTRQMMISQVLQFSTLPRESFPAGVFRRIFLRVMIKRHFFDKRKHTENFL